MKTQYSIKGEEEIKQEKNQIQLHLSQPPTLINANQSHYKIHSLNIE